MASSSLATLPSDLAMALPSPPSSAASLALLHPELQRHIGSFLSVSDAARGVGSASRACRLDFLAGVTHARLAHKPLQLEPDKPEEEHAASLTHLLSQLPGLTCIRCLHAPRDVLLRILGLACRRLEIPLAKLAYLGTNYFGIGPDEPHPLAQALAEGRFPALQVLDGRQWKFFRQPNNAQLSEQALMGGHLTRLERLCFDICPSLDSFCCGLLRTSQATQQRQAKMRDVYITHFYGDSMTTENLKRRCGCLASLGWRRSILRRTRWTHRGRCWMCSLTTFGTQEAPRPLTR
jgi:hypothetical protein